MTNSPRAKAFMLGVHVVAVAVGIYLGIRVFDFFT
jgi:hypothetical protein